jgi:hypothetical protein
MVRCPDDAPPMLRTSVVTPSPCLTGYHCEQEMQDLFVLEDGENGNASAFVAAGVLPACNEPSRIHAHDLPAAVHAADERRPR